MAELIPHRAARCTAGPGVAFLVGVALRRTVLPPGVPLRAAPAAVAAVGPSAGCLSAVHLVARPVLREPVAGLLRRVPPATSWPGAARHRRRGRRRARPRRLVTGDVEGPVGAADAAALALAVGLLGAAAAASTGRSRRSARPGERAARRRPSRHSRWPGARRFGTCSSSSRTATALATFAANAVRRRAAEPHGPCQLEIGAPRGDGPTRPPGRAGCGGRRAARGATRDVTTPVVVIRPRDPSAVPTLLAAPRRAERIGYAVPTTLDAPTPPVAPSIQLEDGEITGTLSWELTSSAPTTPSATRRSRRPASRVVTSASTRRRSRSGSP